MKQLIFVALLTVAGSLGAVVFDPFYGVAVYYIFAVLRPQFIWQWSLPVDVQWSRYVALATLAGAIATQFGIHTRLPKPQGSRSYTSWLLFLFFIWITLSYLFARDREYAHPFYVEYLKIFAMLAASKAILAKTRQLWILLILTALSIGYIAYEVNALYLLKGYLGIAHNGYGGLDNNGAGLMLAMGIPLCLFTWDGMRGRLRWGFFALIPVIIHAVLMTYSRGAMVSLVLTTPLLVMRCRRRNQLIPFMLLLALAMPMMAGPEIRARFFSIQQHNQDESANSRLASWAAAWKMAVEHPFFGLGVRNANLYSYEYGADMQGRTIHSQYLQIAADNGLVGMGIYLTLLVSVIIDIHRARRVVAGRDDPEACQIRSVASSVEGGLAVFCVGGAFLSLETFELPYLLILLGSELETLARVTNASQSQAQV